MALRIEESRDDGRRLIGIFARVADGKGQVLSISAKEGRFLALKDNPDTIILRLIEGQIVQDTGNGTPRVLSFSRHDLPIDLPAIEKFRDRGGKDREYILPELLKIGWSRATPDDIRAGSQASFNYRMVEVVMMFLLPLLAVALAIPPKRSTSALGLFVSIVMIVAYHKINQYGQAVASLGRIDPIIALWGPFFVFGALILWMYWRVAYVPGGQAIGWLERFAANVGKWLKRILRKRRSGTTILASEGA
jgi:lipopolysaccharide export system permease protein